MTERKKAKEQQQLEALAARDSRIAELEAEVQALKKAEISSRTKSEILKSMGHAIRSPVNGIMGMTNLVLETKLTGSQRQHLEMVDSSAGQLLEVVNDILDFCKIEAGEMSLKCEDFDLADSLETDLYLLQLAAREKKIDLIYRVGTDVPEHLNSDPDRLVQVIVNLVNNAIKFTEEGSITVQVEYLGEDDAGRVVLKFSVADTGIGISPQRQKAITDSFTQDLSQYSGTFWGGGLGLIISAHLVHLAAGEIALESSKGEGTTFWFTWSFNKPARYGERIVPAKLKEAAGGDQVYRFENARLLLAEDELVSKILINTLLEQAGIDVTVVENGRQALQEVIAGDYQAVLMDVDMPVMDGLAATATIREYEHEHGGHLPIIALTAHAMPGDREKCLQAGMDDYLAKPVDKNELYRLLHSYLTRSALVVDLDQQIRAAAVEFLVESGWRVILAETERAALYETSLAHFHMVLIDLTRDQERGLATARLIRRLENDLNRQTLIVGIGDETDEDLLLRCSESGIDDIVGFPLSPAQLRTVMDSAGKLHRKD